MSRSVGWKIGCGMLVSKVGIAVFVNWIECSCCYSDHISSGELPLWLEIDSDVVIATTLTAAD